MLKILTYPLFKNELRKPTQILTSEMLLSDVFSKQIQEMSETLFKAGDGAALAANQIGWDVRLFIAIRDADYNECSPQVYINPRILEKSSQLVTLEEGCLSAPGLFLKVPRSQTIKWEYQSLDGAFHEIESKDLFARLVQHETDHLSGRFFFENASSVQRLKVNHWLKQQGF